MPKQKTKKSVSNKVKVSASGKVMRRHQFDTGHKKTNKSKGAVNRAKKGQSFFDGEQKAIKRLLGI